MNCDDFREHLFPFVDGELSGPQAGLAAAHVGECSDCADRAEFERRLESRMHSALMTDANAFDAAAVVAAARGRVADEVVVEAKAVEAVAVEAVAGDASASGAGRGRLLRFRGARGLLAVAATLLLAVQTAWFFCIPPFECSYLQAVERATREVGTPLRPGVVAPPIASRVAVAPALLGFDLEGEASLVEVGYRPGEQGVRARYSRAGESFDVVWSNPGGVTPSFRRRYEIDGRTWWIANENGYQIVAWICPVTETLCSLVSDLPEDRLLGYAEEMRSAER
jgi:hypothetical protein